FKIKFTFLKLCMYKLRKAFLILMIERSVILNNINELWDEILDKMKEKISKTSFETWLKHTEARDLKEDTFYVSVPNEFTKNWLDQRYTQIISALLYEVNGVNVKVKFIITEDQVDNIEENNSASKIIKSKENIANMLNPKYTFVSFVVGTANCFAHAASFSAAEAPTN